MEVIKTRRPHVVPRPYLLHFPATGTSYPISSEEAQRLIDSYPVMSGSNSERLFLRGDDGHISQLYPATLGGGPAFEWSAQ